MAGVLFEDIFDVKVNFTIRPTMNDCSDLGEAEAAPPLCPAGGPPPASHPCRPQTDVVNVGTITLFWVQFKLIKHNVLFKKIDIFQYGS
jgi:hypothetical protein